MPNYSPTKSPFTRVEDYLISLYVIGRYVYFQKKPNPS